jgi:hypothetical protein
LREEDAFGVDAKAGGVAGVESMFDVDKARVASEFLRFGDGVKGEGGFAGRLWTVNFHNAAAGVTAAAERLIQA